MGITMVVPVRLNVYDVGTTPIVEKINQALRAVGTGAFHVGVEVYGSEWSYGYVESGTGVLYSEPEACSKHRFRESMAAGTTSLSQEEVVNIIAELSQDWLGCDYDFLRKNCVSFSEVMLEKLGAGPIPAWVSNLAGAGADASATLLAGATTLLDPSQQAEIAGSVARVASEKASEMDAQYNISSTAKAFLDPSQSAAIAGSVARVASEKASEMDAQHNISSTAKAKLVDMIEASLSLSWNLSGAAALGPLNAQSHLVDRATRAADSSISVLTASEANEQ